MATKTGLVITALTRNGADTFVDATINNGGSLRLSGTAKAQDATVNDGGELHLSGTDRATGTTAVKNGGKVYVSSGGNLLEKTNIAAGGNALVCSGGTVGNAYVFGTLRTFGVITTADIKSGGYLRLESAMLTYGNGQKIANTGYAAATKVSQQTGTYKLSSQLSVDKGTSFAIRSGDTELTTVSLDGGAHAYRA